MSASHFEAYHVYRFRRPLLSPRLCLGRVNESVAASIIAAGAQGEADGVKRTLTLYHCTVGVLGFLMRKSAVREVRPRGRPERAKRKKLPTYLPHGGCLRPQKLPTYLFVLATQSYIPSRSKKRTQRWSAEREGGRRRRSAIDRGGPSARAMTVLHDDVLKDAETVQRMVDMGLISPRFTVATAGRGTQKKKLATPHLPAADGSMLLPRVKEDDAKEKVPDSRVAQAERLEAEYRGRQARWPEPTRVPPPQRSSRAVLPAAAQPASSTLEDDPMQSLLLPTSARKERTRSISPTKSPPKARRAGSNQMRNAWRNVGRPSYESTNPKSRKPQPPAAPPPWFTRRGRHGPDDANAPAEGKVIEDTAAAAVKSSTGSFPWSNTRELPKSLRGSVPRPAREEPAPLKEDLRFSVLGLQQDWERPDMEEQAAPDGESAEEQQLGHEESHADLTYVAMTAGATEDALDAARKFDTRHEQLTVDARRHLSELSLRPNSKRANKHYDSTIDALRSNRFIIPEYAEVFSPGIVGVKKKKKRRKERWRLDKSCWRLRAPDLLETDDAMATLFNTDWMVASGSHELSWFITKCGHDPSTWQTLDRHDKYEGVNRVRTVLWRHRRVIYNAFDYYAVLHSDTVTSSASSLGEPDVFSISFNAFMSFVTRCKMLSKRNPPGIFESIFAVVNAADGSQDAATKEMDAHNSVKSLNRQEFLQCIVRNAVAVHVSKIARAADVAAAVGALIERNLLPNLPFEALQDSNFFRKTFCYVKSTSDVIESASSSLKPMFERYAEVSQGIGDVLRDDDAMSIGEWLEFVRHLGLIDSGQLSVHKAKLIFVWSRIRSLGKGADQIADASAMDRAERKLRHLSLVDFFEALVRMATIISLPTEEEVEAAGALDAGDFLIAMQRDDPNGYREFITSHTPQHSEPDGRDWEQHAVQPVARCLQYLLKLLVRTVEFNTSALSDASQADGVVQDDEIRQFLKMRTKGVELKLKAELSENVDFAAALEIAKAKKIVWAAALKIQMARRIKIARKRMQEQRERMIAAGEGGG